MDSGFLPVFGPCWYILYIINNVFLRYRQIISPLKLCLPPNLYTILDSSLT